MENEQHQPGRKPTEHINYLDSVRGIAALVVVVYHFINWDYKDKLSVKLASIVFNGADAVAFFFVLSGFVLSYKYLVLKRRLDIGKFYVNRFFRLWPAFFVTVVVNALYHNWEGMSLHKLADLFVFNKYAFWQEALLIRPTRFVYYVPGWTLVIELVMSFFVPFAVIIGYKNPKNLWWLAGFFFFMTAGVFGMGMFIDHFTYGVLIAAYYLFITSPSFKQTKVYKYRYAFILAGVVLFSMRPLEKLFHFGWFYDEVIYKYLGYEVFYFSGLGSFILLVFIIQSKKLHGILEHSILRFFGKISYGIYLMHWLVVTYIFSNRQQLSSYFPGEKVAFAALFVICIAVTVLLAVIIYHFIEMPFIRLGKRITAKMKPTMVVDP